MTSEYISKKIYGLMFESFGLGMTYNMQVIIKENLLLNDCMRKSRMTYGILYIWRKYNIQVNIKEISPLNDKLELHFQDSQGFFLKVGD